MIKLNKIKMSCHSHREGQGGDNFFQGLEVKGPLDSNSGRSGNPIK